MPQSTNLNTDGHGQNRSSDAKHSEGVDSTRPRSGWHGFFLDNTFVDLYGPVAGACAMAVFVVLKRHGNKNRQCWPSLKRLAKSTRLSVPTVLKALNKLEILGLLTRQRRQSTKGDPDTTLYTLTEIHSNRGCQNDEQGYKTETGGVLKKIEDGSKHGFHKGSSVNEKDSRREDSPVTLPTEVNASHQFSTRRKPSPPSQKTLLPDDFAITAEMEMWVAQSPDISTLDIQRATNVWMDAMRAHGNQYVNWGAAWQNGMRRAQGWENERGPQRETVPEKLEGRVSSKTARSMQNAVRAANRIKEISNGT